MRTPDGIFFAPGIRFKELNLESSERLADALHLRSAKWFLQPAATLVESSAFASGVVLTCFVDAAAEFAGVGFVEWFKAAVPDSASRDPRRTEKTFADSVYEDVRNGLVHHARLSMVMPCFSIIVRISRGRAPIASRMPISLRRRATAKLMTPYTPTIAITTPIEPATVESAPARRGTIKASLR